MTERAGFCACGCGAQTKINKWGVYNGYVRGHYAKGDRHYKWLGGRVMNAKGYQMVRIAGKYVLEHVSLAEKALGRPLPKGTQVHHVDGNRANNVCEASHG